MFGSGTKNRNWRGGSYISSKGYLRISTRSKRNKYLHRYLIEKLLKNPIAMSYVFPKSGKIPVGMSVHHWDHRKQHNCYGNLQLLQDCIHRYCEKSYQRFISENYEEWVEYWREEGRWE